MSTAAIRSTIPARLDRLSWSPFHARMVAGLGGVVELLFGVNAEGKSLETVTRPLTATDEPSPAVETVPAAT
jgi:hypothetical protein